MAAPIICCDGNFHGGLSVISMSTDWRGKLRSFTPVLLFYLTIILMLSPMPKIGCCGFMVEPIQGEAGMCPTKVISKSKSCAKEQRVVHSRRVQAGIARTGLLACDHEEVRPDILILGKAFQGAMPLSAVFGDDGIMLTSSRENWLDIWRASCG